MDAVCSIVKAYTWQYVKDATDFFSAFTFFVSWLHLADHQFQAAKISVLQLLMQSTIAFLRLPIAFGLINFVVGV